MPKKRKGTNNLPFGKILKGIMSERNLTVRAVAELAGVSASVVQSWLNQSNPHDLKAISKLAQALGLSFKTLLLGEVDSVSGPTTIAEIFEEQDIFDGICRVSIKRLKERGK